MNKVISMFEHDPCLFCGKPMKQRYDEYTPYWECDCKDAMWNRRIDEEIKRLESRRRKPKYEIVEMAHLVDVR